MADPVEAPVPAAPERRRRPVLVAAVGVAVLAGFLVVVFSMARGGGGDTADTPLLGRAAPPVQRTDRKGTRSIVFERDQTLPLFKNRACPTFARLTIRLRADA